MTTLSDPELKVESLKIQHNLTTLVETGCYEGEALGFTKSIGFEHFYTCDINSFYVNKCKQAFPFANIAHQESVSWMRELLPNLSEPTLFWLDAHYPMYYGLTQETEITKFPLVEELRLVRELKKNYEKDVIICDDLRVLGEQDNPYYAGHLDKKFMVSHTIGDLVSILADTHNHWTVSGVTGNLIFVPK